MMIILFFRQESISWSIHCFKSGNRFLNGHIFANIRTYKINTPAAPPFKIYWTMVYSIFICSNSHKICSKIKVMWQLIPDISSITSFSLKYYSKTNILNSISTFYNLRVFYSWSLFETENIIFACPSVPYACC